MIASPVFHTHVTYTILILRDTFTARTTMPQGKCKTHLRYHYYAVAPLHDLPRNPKTLSTRTESM